MGQVEELAVDVGVEVVDELASDGGPELATVTGDGGASISRANPSVVSEGRLGRLGTPGAPEAWEPEGAGLAA